MYTVFHIYTHFLLATWPLAIYRTAIYVDSSIRYRQRFFDQVRHEAMCASSGNKHFFTKPHHPRTYEQSQQKLGTILGNKVP